MHDQNLINILQARRTTDFTAAPPVGGSNKNLVHTSKYNYDKEDHGFEKDEYGEEKLSTSLQKEILSSTPTFKKLDTARIAKKNKG